MALVFRALHAPKDPATLNEEWLVLENTGGGPVTAQGCALTVARSASDRPRPLGTIDPGFVLKPGEKIRLVTGSPGKKAQGTPPADDLKNYHLFLKEPVLARPGVVVRLAMKQHELARATFAPGESDGLQRG